MKWVTGVQPIRVGARPAFLRTPLGPVTKQPEEFEVLFYVAMNYTASALLWWLSYWNSNWEALRRPSSISTLQVETFFLSGLAFPTPLSDYGTVNRLWYKN